jgi:hypothetical protein
MAVNKPVGDNARKGAVKKRTQLKNPLTKTSTADSDEVARAFRDDAARGFRHDVAQGAGLAGC